MLFVNKKKRYVTTYKEIGIFFIIFTIVLFVLYPKQLLLQEIMSKQTNYSLGVIYLKNMLYKNPNDEKIMLDLATLEIKSNNYIVASFYLTKLRDSKDKKIRRKTYLLDYSLTKKIYFQKNSTFKKKQEVMKNLKKIFSYILKYHFYSLKNISKWYNEAMFLHKFNSAYILLKEMVRENPNNIKRFENLFYLSLRLHKKDEAMSYLHILQTKDLTKRNMWLMDEYYILMNNKKYKKVEFFLQTNAQNSIIWRDRLASFYFDRKEYVKSSNQYIKLFHKSLGYTNKKKFFLKAINTLRAGDLMKKAANLAYKYQSYFLNKINMRIYLLKLYISAGSLHKATLLSKKILKIKRNKV